MAKSSFFRRCYALVLFAFFSFLSGSAANWLCFTAEEDNVELWYENVGGNKPNVEYSMDEGLTWETLDANVAVKLEQKGAKVYVRGNNPEGFSFANDKNTYFRGTGTVSASGSVMSLIDGVGETKEIPNESCFYYLFFAYEGLIHAPELPATVLKEDCYDGMFCYSGLTEAPVLPATQLEAHCYEAMFSGCRNLTKAPELPALTLKDFCYTGMFHDCENLTQAPELPATTLAKYCYMEMFKNCKSLTKAPDLPAAAMEDYCCAYMYFGCSNLKEAPVLSAETMADDCCHFMFYECTSLEKAPELPAMTLAEDCYSFMFSKCSSLTQVPELPATTLANACYLQMFAGCSNLIHAQEILPAEELTPLCYSRMFEECSSLVRAPELPAKELALSCYEGMFNRCSNLNYIKVGVMSLDNELQATTVWVIGVDGEGEFIFPCGSKYDKHGYSEVPTNFKIVGSPIVVFQNQDGTELQRDTILCGEMPEYRGETPIGENFYVFKGWDKELAVIVEPGIYYYTAEYEPTGESNYLCFTAEKAGSTISYVNVGNNPDVQYSFDGVSWSTLEENGIVELDTVNAKVYFRGNNPDGFSKNANSYTRFVMTGSIAASGSVMSLIDEVGAATEIPSTCCFLDLFLYCSSLTKAPDLTATVLNDSCYWSMFDNCTNLKEAPRLPLKTLAPYCYTKMFYKCEGLTTAPELPATVMAEGCYEKMFYECSNLEVAPTLPAETLAPSCYQSMFSRCSKLTTAPLLPATTMARSCYEKMFYGCSNLTEAPELPATKLAEQCYAHMFGLCENLEKAPDLLANELEKECYYSMFERCSSLNYMKVGVMTLDNEVDAMSLWVSGVEGPGRFYFPCGSKYDKHGDSEVPNNFEIISSPIVVFLNSDSTELQRDTLLCGQIPEYKGEMPTIGADYVFKGWNKKLTVLNEPDIYYYLAEYEEALDPSQYNWLCFTAEEDNSYFSYKNVGENDPDVQLSWDEGKTWVTMMADSFVFLEHVGDKVYLRGYNPDGFSKTRQDYTRFQMQGSIAATGSVMSLTDGTGVSTEIPADYCFHALFDYCKALTHAPELPATTLKAACYAAMFGDCSRLKEAPELPATQMMPSCYTSMFSGCHSLTVAPRLNSVDLAYQCYCTMFTGCVSLTDPPELPATELADQCYLHMFSHCLSLVDAPKLPATTMKDMCYLYMFSGCTSLEVAPELPATELADQCYGYMFSECSYLKKAPELPAENLSPWCYFNMFSDCPSLTRAPELPATKMEEGCYLEMFKGCRSLIQAPELPAKELVKGCYYGMFQDCSDLTYIKVGVMSLDNDKDATTDWVRGVNEDGLFVFPCGSKYDKHGVSEVPFNFTIEASPIVIFLNPDSTELYRDTIGCDVVAEYRGETPTYGDDYEFVGWEPELQIHEKPDVYYYMAVYKEKEAPEQGNWLCFTAEEAWSVVDFYTMGQNNPDLQYSMDGGKTWETPLESGIILKYKGDKVYLRGNNPNGFSQDPENFTLISLSGRVAASGSLMSLIDGKGEVTEIPNDYCFYRLFQGSKALVSAPELTATKLKKSCYEYMFVSCDSLEHAPELPATTLADRCYKYMFFTCHKLKEAPKLPATTLAEECYYQMFFACNRLKETPLLPATELAKSCYEGMFFLCDSLTKMSDLPATKMEEACYRRMFFHCVKLQKASELPAKELAKSCYEGMFEECPSLLEIPELPATELAPSCYEKMFFKCDHFWKTPKLPATTLASRCYAYMFSETLLGEIPELPATELFDYCYAGMFKDGGASTAGTVELPATELVEGCYEEMFTNVRLLDSIKVGVLSLDNDFGATTNWVDGINYEGVFVFPCGSKYDKHGVSEVPKNFEIISSPIVIFLNPDSTELYRDTIPCDVVAEYKGNTPTYGANSVFVGWNKELTVLGEPGMYYYTACYDFRGEDFTLLDSVISVCDSFFVDGRLLREDTQWRDTVVSDSLVITYHLKLSHSVERDSFLSACESITLNGETYRESALWSDTLISTTGCDSVVNYHLTILHGVVKDTTIFAEEQFAWKEETYTEDASWNDTLQSVSGCDSIVRYNLVIRKNPEENYTLLDSVISACDSFFVDGRLLKADTEWKDTLLSDSVVITYHLKLSHSVEKDSFLSACEILSFHGTIYRESAVLSDTLIASTGCDSVVNYHLIVHHGVVNDSSIVADEQFSWKGMVYTDDATWSDTLQTIFGCDSIVNYKLIVHKFRKLHLTVDDDLILVLPGGQVMVGYDLSGGVGSKYEIRYGDKLVCVGAVENDSTVLLDCPSDMEPGSYVATMSMSDAQEGKAEAEFVFNVMLPDIKENSYYVKVWNDVVICRNGEGLFETFQWYKDRQVLDNATLQHYNDLTLLDGEYMVYVNDKYGKSYFIEPVILGEEKAAYALTATPALVNRASDFVLTVSGVAPDEMDRARLVIYRTDGTVMRVVDMVQEKNTMRLWPGEYVIMLTVNDGKVAYCKVVVR